MVKIYFAGAENKTFFDLLRNNGAKNFLMSFYSISKENLTFSYSELKDDIFIDSGGFTFIKNKDRQKVGKEKISYIRDYILFLKKYKFPIYANIDVIEPEETLRNQQIMEKAGLNPIPVYHLSEFKSEKWRYLLEEYCSKYNYVAIGGLVKASKIEITECLNYCFKIARKYKTKLHGFGITKTELLKKYPFYSVDSSSWLGGGRYGRVFLFQRKKLKCCSKQTFYKKYSKYNNLPYQEINKWNIIQWVKFSEYLKEYWKEKRYWESEDL